MPKLSGNDIISDLTEKYGRRLIAISFITILVKVYDVSLEKLSIFSLNLPPELFNIVALSLVIYFTYALVVNWLGDLAAFRLWFESNNITSEMGTEIKTDKTFINSGVSLIRRLYALEKGGEWPENYEGMEPEVKKEFEEFKLNTELFNVRLEAAGTKFSALSMYGHVYIWFQSFALPVGLGLIALHFLLCAGSIIPAGTQ
jgi:hypothetical protein